MPRSINATCVYGHLDEKIDTFVQKHINPELFFSAATLDGLSHQKLIEQAAKISDAGLSTTIHAAFFDLNPGSVDAAIRKVTRFRFEQIFDAALIFKPQVIVFHPGYDELRYGSNRSAWLDHSIDFWKALLPRAGETGCVIAIENIFEKEPSTLCDLLNGINNPGFRHCFDVGHWNMFKTIKLEEWFSELGSYIVEAHIHDNHGQADEHLPPGEGEIEFDLLFTLLKRYAPDAIWTIEAHTNERLARSLNNIQTYL